MKVILRSLGELTGAQAAGSFIESLDLGEVWASYLDRSHKLTTIPQTDGMKRKELEHHCGRFIKSIQSLMEKEGSSVPESLKVSLDRLITYDLSCF